MSSHWEHHHQLHSIHPIGWPSKRWTREQQQGWRMRTTARRVLAVVVVLVYGVVVFVDMIVVDDGNVVIALLKRNRNLLDDLMRFFEIFMMQIMKKGLCKNIQKIEFLLFAEKRWNEVYLYFLHCFCRW
jgi:hypothetical protein